MAFVDGCEYKTIDTPTPPNIHILECKVCGAQSISWSFNSLEKYK
jgi:hypothetical protein